jgi:hypothetical protein
MDLNDGKGTLYEAGIFEFDMDCDKTRGKFWEEGMDSDMSFNYAKWGGFGESEGWKGIRRLVPPPTAKMFEFNRGYYA